MVSVCMFWAASTRALYEKKLKRLLDSSAQASQHRVNGTRDAGLYSDNEEEDEEDGRDEDEAKDSGREEDEDKDSGKEQHWLLISLWVAWMTEPLIIKQLMIRLVWVHLTPIRGVYNLIWMCICSKAAQWKETKCCLHVN